MQAAMASGWLPKNPALAPAMYRASPASMRFGLERNRETEVWSDGTRLDRLDPEATEDVHSCAGVADDNYGLRVLDRMVRSPH